MSSDSPDTPNNGAILTVAQIIKTFMCKRAEEEVPGEIFCIGGLESEGVLVVWYLR